jgi:vitamin K-dependent gamma-carboxylase
MYGLYGAIALAALCVALGLYYRLAIALFFVLFSYAELTDVTHYLNHYYLVSLLALLMSFMPLSASGSLDVLHKPGSERSTLPAYMLYLLRFQVAVVYLGAALAKLNSDWLVHGQPLNIWLSSHVDLPLIGGHLGSPRVALFASWAGFVHDLLVVPLLLWRRSRPYAYALLLGFHLLTSTWFNIGIFPVLMPIAATLFFAPSWPRDAWMRLRALAHGSSLAAISRSHVSGDGDGFSRCVEKRSACSEVSAPTREQPSPSPSKLSRIGAVGIAAYCVLQVALPLRAHVYGGNVLWHEQGMRYSWRVMVRAKLGSVDYRVRLRDGRELHVSPRRYLTAEQEREMSGQPDLILQLAHHIGRELAARGHGDAQVFVDARVSLNGRKPALLIEPEVNLLEVRDGLARAAWIRGEPGDEPIRLEPAQRVAQVVR